ncbi:gelsolin-like [Culicoides brevitarsis]|uniref:gelsolin-like n=1 Tax=Culicoides brevitarsis TaxID=469753 RepID=UPI00307C5B8F
MKNLVKHLLITSALLVFCFEKAFSATSHSKPNLVKGTIMHDSFVNAGKQKGLEIWRIENFQPVPYPSKDYGKFYSGDSYIVLNTKIDDKGKPSWDIHFWLGLETSQDEAGSAAIYTVQLDDQLGGEPVQHREVENHESQLFLSYFKNGLRYEAGGVASGFKKVETNAAGAKRLFQVKGKKNIRVRQVNLSVSAMNKGDCFILDNGREIYVWVGKDSKRIEKLKAISAANQIRDQDHAGRANVIIVDEFSPEIDQIHFFEALGSGSYNSVPDSSTSEDDADFEQSEARRVMLYKISDSAGDLKIDTISEKPLRQEMLKSDDCFILDTGSSIYVWVGKKATKQEKEKSMQHAQMFLSTKKYPSWTEIHRTVEGAETAPFKQYFATWRDFGASHSRLIRSAIRSDIESNSNEIDDQTFKTLKKSGGHALGFMPDQGNGERTVWLVQNNMLIPVPRDNYGVFFGGDSYVVKYVYNNKKGAQSYIIYYWLGKESSEEQKLTAANFANKIDEEVDGKSIQIRIAHGYETRHFLKIFKGKLIIKSSGHIAELKNVFETEGTTLYRVRGTSSDDVRVEQLKEVSNNLASDDVFILITLGTNYIWYGKGGSKFEKEMAHNIVKNLKSTKNIITLEEGKEPDEFWRVLGGKLPYDTEIDPAGAPLLEIRMFHCKILSKSKKIKFEEILNYEQSDLAEDDVMLLDGGDEIYIWIGVGTTSEEKKKSMYMAMAYLMTDPTERNENTAPIILIHQHFENPGFKNLFPSWNDSFW